MMYIPIGVTVNKSFLFFKASGQDSNNNFSNMDWITLHLNEQSEMNS